MGTFVWRARRSAADIRLKNWYNHRRADKSCKGEQRDRQKSNSDQRVHGFLP